MAERNESIGLLEAAITAHRDAGAATPPGQQGRAAALANLSVENQAHTFAAAFLMPAQDIRGELPQHADWPALFDLKR